MTIFCIETSTAVCSAAWCIDGQCVAQRIHTEGSNHAALLPQFIQELIEDAHINHYHADAVAVSEGPGSYTGLRIGVSTAKGLCYGWNIPLIAVPTLDILTELALQTQPSLPSTLLPMIDARRMEVYTALYQCTTTAYTASPTMAKVVESSDWLPTNQPVYYFGDGASKCQQILQGDNIHFIDQIIPKASAMGLAIMHHTYPLITEKELAYYTPFYLKEFVAAPSHIKGLK